MYIQYNTVFVVLQSLIFANVSMYKLYIVLEFKFGSRTLVQKIENIRKYPVSRITKGQGPSGESREHLDRPTDRTARPGVWRFRSSVASSSRFSTSPPVTRYM